MPRWSATLTPYRLPFRHPWRSHAGLWRERHGWLLRLADREGHLGFGDAAPLPEMGSESAADCEAWLQTRIRTLCDLVPEQALSKLVDDSDHPAARCALECALLDLQGQQQQRPLWQLMGAAKPEPVRLNAVIGELDETVTSRAADAVAAGFDTLKLKLAVYPKAKEQQRLQRLLTQLPEGIRLRLDANRAWSPEQALSWIRRLNDLPVESLEEPLAEWDADALRRLQQAAHFDLAVDESLAGFLRHHPLATLPVRRIVIKPVLLGGLLPGCALIRQAATLGRHCVITSSLESSAGLWPLHHLAALADQVTGPVAHGLATSGLFSRNLAPAPVIRHGQITPGEQPGSGFIVRQIDLNQEQE